MFVIKDSLELFLKSLLRFFEFVFEVLMQLFLFLFKFFNSFVQNFNVKFELLLYLDVVSNFSFVLLKLLLVFFWWQIDTLKSRGEACVIQDVFASSTGIEIAKVVNIVQSMILRLVLL